MTDEARDAALAERERIAVLADRASATYSLKGRDASFADLIRSGATLPPWYTSMIHPPDPLAVPAET